MQKANKLFSYKKYLSQHARRTLNIKMQHRQKFSHEARKNNNYNNL